MPVHELDSHCHRFNEHLRSIATLPCASREAGYCQAHLPGFLVFYHPSRRGTGPSLSTYHPAPFLPWGTGYLSGTSLAARQVREENRLFAWEKSTEFGTGELKFLGQVCAHLGYPTEQLPAYLTGENPDLIELFPEARPAAPGTYSTRLASC